MPSPLRGEIAFEHVTFHYPQRPDQAALTDFNLHVRPGDDPSGEPPDNRDGLKISGPIDQTPISNIVIDVQGPDKATGMCYALLYSGSIDKPAEKFGLQAVPPQLVGEYQDEFVLTPAGWRFQELA